jgi:hypothetical protein
MFVLRINMRLDGLTRLGQATWTAINTVFKTLIIGYTHIDPCHMIHI